MAPFKFSLSVLLVVSCAALAILPGIAAAQSNSGVDQYSEGVPGSGGNNHGGHGNSNGGQGSGEAGGSGGSTLPTSVAEDLAGSGSDGAALAALVDATAPSSKELRDAAKAEAGAEARADEGAEAATGGGSSDVGSAALETLDTSSDGAAVSAITAAATSSDSEGGMGGVLPFLLIAATVLAVVFVVARARRA